MVDRDAAQVECEGLAGLQRGHQFLAAALHDVLLLQAALAEGHGEAGRVLQVTFVGEVRPSHIIRRGVDDQRRLLELLDDALHFHGQLAELHPRQTVGLVHQLLRPRTAVCRIGIVLLEVIWLHRDHVFGQVVDVQVAALLREIFQPAAGAPQGRML